MSKPGKVRLDHLLLERGVAPTRSSARSLIMAGLVLVDGRVVDKAGTQVAADVPLSLKQRRRYVSRGGEKLRYALEVFCIDPRASLALDVGSSTGGFVDCLVKSGAAEVVALDVGHGHLDPKLRHDPRIHVLEKVNARYLIREQLPYVPDFLTVDVSFISLEKVLPTVVSCMAPAFTAVLLAKPQFEAGRSRVGKGGIVRDAAVHEEVLIRLTSFLVAELALTVKGMARSGLLGTGGNTEFVMHVDRGKGEGLSSEELATLARRVVAASGEEE